MNLQRLFDGGFNVILLRSLGEHDVHREGAAGDFEDGHTAKKICEFSGVERGRGDDELEIVAPRDNLTQDAKQQVGVDGALVRLVHNDAGVGIKVLFLQRLTEQDAISHVLDECFLAILVSLVLEPDGITDLLPDFTAHFLGDPLGDGHSGHTTGLKCEREQF